MEVFGGSMEDKLFDPGASAWFAHISENAAATRVLLQKNDALIKPTQNKKTNITKNS